MLKRTPLYDAHLAAGARIVPFAGWEMPVQYSGVIDEVRAVRHAAGVFDVSHMGEALVSGPAALAWLNSLTTNDVARLSPGRAQYSLLLREDGGILDDLLVYQIGVERYLLVLNASNTEKDLTWLRDHPVPGVELTDVSDDTSLLALQGPGALPLLAPLTTLDLAGMRRFGCAFGTVAGVPALVARTGYTGEDGFELFVGVGGWGLGVGSSGFGPNPQPPIPNPQRPTPNAPFALWDALLAAGAKPCGLGARDVLRIEAGNVLYGHEIDEQTTPLEAGLEWVVKPEKGAFMGSDAIRAATRVPANGERIASGSHSRDRERSEHPAGEAVSGPPRRLVGLVSQTRAIPRQGYPIARGSDTLGVVTSGTFSPTLDRPIAMGYVNPSAAGYPPPVSEGEAVEIVIRGRPEPARVVALPFCRGRR